MPLDEVNEGQTWFVLVEFTDKDKQPVVPSSGSYRIDDLFSGETIKDDTPLPSLDTSVEIEITGGENAMVDSSLPSEIRVVTVTWKYDADNKDGVNEYKYKLKNIWKKS